MRMLGISVFMTLTEYALKIVSGRGEGEGRLAAMALSLG